MDANEFLLIDSYVSDNIYSSLEKECTISILKQLFLSRSHLFQQDQVHLSIFTTQKTAINLKCKVYATVIFEFLIDLVDNRMLNCKSP